MNRIDTLFQQKPNGIFSVYFTAGFPAFDSTREVIRELVAQGTDLIEVGIPFSDPMADGPVIQQSSTVALENGMTLRKLFDQLEGIRDEVSIPLVMMGYLNPIMQMGIEPFCKRCSEVGIDGVIIPDLPFNDYIANYKPIADKYGIHFIMLITPATSEERIRLIDAHTAGFIYMVSSASTTGAQSSFGDEKQDYFRRINGMGLKNPRLIGFGISNKATLEAAQQNANGAIIGSTFIQCLSQTSDVKSAVSLLMDKMKG